MMPFFITLLIIALFIAVAILSGLLNNTIDDNIKLRNRNKELRKQIMELKHN